MFDQLPIGYGLIVVFFVLAGFLVLTYNKLSKLKINVEESFSTMDVYLKKRYDLISNLVETVKGYAEYEQETLERVTQARKQALGGRTRNEVLAANKQITAGLSNLLALGEAYPDLKANTTYMNLQESLKQVEKDVANARLYYNGCVKLMNRAIIVFPTVMVAALLGFKTMGYYEATSDERAEVRVRLRN